MAVLTIKTDGSKLVDSFWDKTFFNMRKSDIARNPFDARYSFLNRKTLILSITPLYPKFFIFGLLPLILGFTLSLPTVLVIGCIIFGMGVLWTSPFYMLVIYFGLKKHGYKGKISFLSNSATLLEVIQNGAN